MQTYRDQYASLFKDGRGVVLLAISDDHPDVLASWAKDADFQWLFGSDPSGAAYAAFGGDPRDNGQVTSRAVIVVDPGGKVAEVIPRFNQVDPAAYERLKAAVDRVTPTPEGGDPGVRRPAVVRVPAGK
jgi:peroxiredoxin Q/BCP